MKEYDVKITETLEKTITVQAESRDAAEEQVKTAYYNSEYILDAENFTGVEFGTQDEREIQHEQAETMNVLLVRPNMYPQAVEIGCELEDLQKAVGGDIEAVYPFEEPVAPPQPSRPVRPPRRIIISPGSEVSLITLLLGAAAITAPISIRFAT